MASRQQPIMAGWVQVAKRMKSDRKLQHQKFNEVQVSQPLTNWLFVMAKCAKVRNMSVAVCATHHSAIHDLHNKV